MEQYILKSALVAEIEKLKDKAIDSDDRVKWYLYNDVIKAIDTLEVKGVNLEKEMDEFHTFFLEPTIVPVVRVHFFGVKKVEV